MSFGHIYSGFAFSGYLLFFGPQNSGPVSSNAPSITRYNHSSLLRYHLQFSTMSRRISESE